MDDVNSENTSLESNRVNLSTTDTIRETDEEIYFGELILLG